MLRLFIPGARTTKPIKKLSWVYKKAREKKWLTWEISHWLTKIMGRFIVWTVEKGIDHCWVID